MAESVEQISGEWKTRWRELDLPGRRQHFFALPPPQAENLFEKLSKKEQMELIGELSLADWGVWIRLLRLDDAADLIQKLPAELRSDTLAHFDENARREIIGLMAYAEDAAGGLMNPRYIRIRPDMTVGEAARYLSAQAKKNVEIVYYSYVLERDQRLIGVLSFRNLLLAKEDEVISDIMHRDVVSVPEQMDREEVLRLFSKYHFIALPVVDADGHMKGIVTHDDLAKAAQQVATEDMQKVGGMEALDAPYFQVSLFDMLKKRGGWLMALFIGEMATATAMAHYEQEIAQALVLVLFIPLIISSGGNSGSQATTLIIRSLALKEIRLKDWWRVMHRELVAGLMLGILLASIGFLRVIIWQYWKPSYGEHYWLVAVTVACSLVGVVLWGTLTGSMLPFLLRKLGFDPASASAPFVATLVDVTGLIIYFSVASMILSGTLL
ncbi:MAG: magnesium transporter [Myxococcota bacterium]